MAGTEGMVMFRGEEGGGGGGGGEGKNDLELTVRG